MVSVFGFSFASSAGGPSSGWLPDRYSHVDGRLNVEEGNDSSDVLQDNERDSIGGEDGASCSSSNPWSSNNTVEEPTDAISVRMSIWRDLCAGHQADERQVNY